MKAKHLDRRISIRASDDDIARIERLKIRLHNYLVRQGFGQYVEVNQRNIILEGLTQLERFLDEQEKEAQS